MDKRNLPSRIVLEKEVRSIRALQAFGTWQGRIWIGISFTHMVTTMLLFRPSGVSPVVKAVLTVVLGATVLLMDIGIMHYSHVLYLNKEAKGPPAPLRILITYYLAVLAEWIFNFGSLYSNRPGPDKLPGFLSVTLAILFGSFVTLSILNAPLLVSMLDHVLFPKLDQLAARIQAEQAEADRLADEKRRKDEQEEDDKRRRQERDEELRQRREERRQNRQRPALPSPVLGLDRQLPPVDESAQYQPKAVNVDEIPSIEVDGKLVRIDERAAEWLTMKQQDRPGNRVSYQDISNAMGGTPSKQYIGLHVKLYQQWLVVHAERD